MPRPPPRLYAESVHPCEATGQSRKARLGRRMGAETCKPGDLPVKLTWSDGVFRSAYTDGRRFASPARARPRWTPSLTEDGLE